MSTLKDLFATNTDLLWAAFVSAFVSAAITFGFKLWETRDTAKVEYEYEQRKKLEEMIGSHHGRLLNAAVSMNNRMWNLYEHQGEKWMIAGGSTSKSAYYFRSSVYRFMGVGVVVRLLEEEAILLDVRIAKKSDYTFLNFAAAFHWVMTDVALFNGLEYDLFNQKDHFFSDTFRQYSDRCIKDGKFITIAEFYRLLDDGAKDIEPVLAYFDGLTKDEQRLRWDRLVAFHLLLLAFINSFGYRRQYSLQRSFLAAAEQIEHPKVLENLIKWLPRHDLGANKEARKIVAAARALQRAR